MIFDGLGAELVGGDLRGRTPSSTPRALRALSKPRSTMSGDMVFSPLFDELDSEREVVLEEIAMYEDTPQELVHDLISEAVFGSHPLGRPVIGTAEVISNVSRRSIQTYHRTLYVAIANVVLSCGREHRPRPAAGSSRPSSAELRRWTASRSSIRRSSRRRSPGCASSARTPSSTTSASARPASRLPTAGGSSRRSSTRCSAARRRRGSSRRSARSAGWRTRSTPSARSTPTPARSGVPRDS